MNINPSYESIGSIFEQNILLEVPKYQRYYLFPTRAALPLDHPDILGN